jgi:hypothetical protein
MDRGFGYDVDWYRLLPMPVNLNQRKLPQVANHNQPDLTTPHLVILSLATTFWYTLRSDCLPRRRQIGR